MMKQQHNATMIRFDKDIDMLIREVAKRKRMTLSDIVRGYVIEGLANDDLIWIDEDGDFHITK